MSSDNKGTITIGYKQSCRAMDLTTKPPRRTHETRMIDCVPISDHEELCQIWVRIVEVEMRANESQGDASLRPLAGNFPK
eukprot:scaffold21733_cov120-Skeletonema_marinoi.AAC.1